MLGSSSSSDRAFTLEPEPSRLLLVWWGGLHALLCATAWSLSPGLEAGLALTAACTLHAALRRPRRAPRIEYTGGGRWAVPAWRLENLELDPGTAFSTRWARLVWWARDGQRVSVVLTRDQLCAEVWWRLQTVLRDKPVS